MNYNISKKEKLGSILAFSLIISPIVASFFSRYVNVTYSGIAVIAGIWLLLLWYIINYRLVIYRKWLLFTIYISIIVLVSFINIQGHVDILALQFFEYGILGLLISITAINPKYFFDLCTRSMIFLAVPCFILINNSATNIYTDDVNMGMTYGIMPLLFAIIAHFYLYKNSSSFICKISYIITAIITCILIIRGTRGFTVCLIIMIYLLLSNNDGYNISKRKFILQIFIVAFMIVVILNAENIILLFATTINKLGIQFNSLEKMVYLISNGNITNGRTDIYRLAWEGFLDSPILGNGIGVFTDRFGSPYMPFIHNIFLQLLYELGCVLPIPIFLIMINGLWKILFAIIDEDVKCFFLVLFSASVPMLFLSSELWFNRVFWLMCGYYLGALSTRFSNSRD